MDFAAVVIFLALYYLRPQEWLTDFNRLHPIQLLSVVAIWALASKGKLKTSILLRTPLDWLMLAYFAWSLVAGFQPLRAFIEIQSVVLLYFLAVSALDSVPRLTKLLRWWCAFIFFITIMALLSQAGFDPFGGQPIVTGPMKGRLILNLSIFNNPNALAHSIIPAVPLVYYLFYWRRTVMKAAIAILIAPLWCIYLTLSKGAFLSGFVTLLVTLLVGRSKPAQIVILLLAMGFGYGALYQLPRMSEISHAQTDPAIQGRVAAFTFGLSMMRANFFGLGLDNFQKFFFENGPTEKYRIVRVVHVNHLGDRRRFIYVPRHYTKAPHSAYNENGAELGYVGLGLFVGILYCCIRTLLLAKSSNDDEERIRRALFAMVVAYAVSSWMVDFCYRPTFFMMVAAISAFHRHLLRGGEAKEESVEALPAPPERPWMRRLPPVSMPGLPGPSIVGTVPAAATTALMPSQNFASRVSAPPFVTAQVAPLHAPGPAYAPPGQRLATLPRPRDRFGWAKGPSFEETLRQKLTWTRLELIDYVLIVALTYATILYWQHLIATM